MYTAKTKYRNFEQIFPEKEYRGLSPNFHMRLWAIYIFPRSVSLFCWRKFVDRSWNYINRSWTNECWNWGWGRAIPRKGIYKGDFRCSVGTSLRWVCWLNTSGWSWWVTTGWANPSWRAASPSSSYSSPAMSSPPTLSPSSGPTSAPHRNRNSSPRL